MEIVMFAKIVGVVKVEHFSVENRLEPFELNRLFFDLLTTRPS